MTVPVLKETIKALIQMIEADRRSLFRALGPSPTDTSVDSRAAIEKAAELRSALAHAVEYLATPFDLPAKADPHDLTCFLASARRYSDALGKLDEPSGFFARLEAGIDGHARQYSSALAAELASEISRCRNMQRQLTDRLQNAQRVGGDALTTKDKFDALVEASLRRYPIINAYLAR